MDIKKFLIICLVLFIICSFSAVSAADAEVDKVNNTLSASEGDVVSESNDLSSLSVSNEDTLGAGGGSFSELNSIINDGTLGDNPTIDLYKNYTYVSSIDSAYKDGIAFNKQMTIDGHGFTIDGNNLARIFDIGYNGNIHAGTGGLVKLKNIRFVNAYNGDTNHLSAFGALRFGGIGALENCTFSNNKAGDGAALTIEYTSSFTINGCTFDSNTATANGGGAIRVKSGVTNLVIKNSKFNNNQAPSSGGAVHIASSGAGTVIDNCNFTSNTAKSGGVLHIEVNDIKITNSRFIKNTATYNENNENGGGGAIIVVGNGKKNLDIINCSFKDNSATKIGGAIYSGTLNNMVIKNSNFTNNAANAGGAIFSTNAKDITVLNSSFNANKATNSVGGALYIKTSSLVNIDKCNFTDNYALRGGAIRTENTCTDWNLTNVRFVGNRVLYEGGGFSHNQLSYRFHFENCTFINCSTINSGMVWGGALYTHAEESLYKNMLFINCSSYMGGSWDAKSTKKCNMVNITIINSTSVQQGGAIRVWGPDSVLANITIINSTSGNAWGHGGAIALVVYESRNPSSAKISNIRIINSSAPNANGGAIYTEGSSGTFTNITVINSHAKDNGGAFYFNSPYQTLNIFNITNSTAGGNGGSIYINDDNSVVSNGNISDGYANNGGAIYINGNIAKISDVTIDNCNATQYGGAIFVDDHTDIRLTNITFNSSNAYNGGGLYYKGKLSASVWVSNCTFTNNNASHNGGAVYYAVGESGSDSYNVNRDYNNFDGKGVITDGRTTVDIYGADGSSYIKRIANSYFKNNNDYLLTGDAKPSTTSLMGIVTITSPKGHAKNPINIVINVTKDGVLVTQVVIDSSNYNNYYVQGSGIVSVNVRSNLEKNTEYNVSVGFEDNDYLYKEFITSFTTANVMDKGDFHILQGLIDATPSGDVLVLERSYEFTSKEDFPNVELPDNWCMNITKPITINGQGYSISALGYSRIFIITSNDVILNNVNFIQGDTYGKNQAYVDGDDRGGAILWSMGARGQLNDCTVSSNHAEYGGGLYLDEGATNTKIRNCSFVSNNAEKRGGAIDCNAPSMNLTNTVFEKNRADTGAALCREVHAIGGFGVNNTFIANHAETNGSALAWIQAENININHYKFINNTAGYSGGAIYVGEGSTNCIVNNSYFEGNNVTNLNDGHGGAIEWYANQGKVLNTTFINNNAYLGGAIFVGEESQKIDVIDSNFTNNNAYKDGGAINVEGSNVVLNNTRFTQNTAEEGGAVFVGGHGRENYVYDSVFEDNKATNGKGGAVNWVVSSSHLIRSNFTRNNASTGGAVYFGGDSSESEIRNCIFTANNAKYNGGAIDCNSSKMNLSNTKFDANYAQFGAALCREPGAAGGFGKNNTFINNHAYLAGAALGWMGSVNISITNYTFINNSADIGGGAIYVSPDSHNCSIISSNFEDNYVTDVTRDWQGTYEWTAWDGSLMQFSIKSSDDSDLIGKTIVGVDGTTYYYPADGDSQEVIGVGGAISCQASNATIKYSNFTNNSARLGGALHMGADSGHTDIDYSIFKSNEAWERGGAVNLRASAVHIDDSEFYSNSAINGSALYVGGIGTNNIVHRSVFEGNDASDYGGGIYWRASAGEIKDSNFTFNNARYGGGIYLNGISSNSNITNVIFKYNTASKNGGAIDCNSTNMGLYNTSFESNYAGEYGAALCREADATGGHGKNNTFISNHADISGAALAWLDVENININNYTFINNTAEHSGGAIYISQGSDNCVIFNSTFKGNHLTNMSDRHFGGAIDCVADNLTVNMSSFKNNGANDGGAIYVGSGSSQAHILKSNFTSNYATADGGAIALKAHDLTVNESRFNLNTASGSGGAIYVGGSGQNNIVHNSVFEENKAGKQGGAIDWLAKAGEIINSNFTKNDANYGGAIYLNGESDKSKISHVIFKNNTATENGGAIDCNAKEMNLTHTKFISNYAKYGAALCREPGATGGFGGNNTFDKNHAYISGAALAWLGVDNIHINNYTFTNNTADFSGGAIYVSENSHNCKIYNSTFKDDFVTNAISGRGGAIDWLGNNGTIANTTFNTCISRNGGGVYVGDTSDNMTIINTTFTLCNSLTDGGSISIHGDNATIFLCNFTSSVAMDNGGAIAGFNSNNGNISNCTFKYNSAAGHIDPDKVFYGEGGAIYWENSTNLRVSSSKFISNTAHLSGGSISADNCNDSVIYGITTFDETAFRNGGSISWINSNNLTIDKSYFNDSGANYFGGSIYLSNVNDTTVKNTGINSSWASWEVAGGIYVDGNVTIDHVEFNDTHSYYDNATAIYFQSGVSSVSNSNFTVAVNAIGIGKEANVTLTRNNLTSEHPTKKITYIESNSPDAYKAVDYAVWNDGNLWLDKNSFDTVIFNNGNIWTKTTTRMLDNKTYNVTWNETFMFFANITDDNLNTIISVKSLNTTNDIYTDAKNHYVLKYNADGIKCIYQGVFHLTAIDNGLKQNDVLNGTLNVKMPVDMNLNIVQTTPGNIAITATLTPKVKSNYTINGEKIFFEMGGKKFNVTVNGCPEKWESVVITTQLGNLTSGYHTLTATYNGDDLHLGAEAVNSTEIALRESWITVIIANVDYGQTAVAVVTTNSNGTVRLNFHGKEEVVEVPMTRTTDGNYSGTVNITVGEYLTTGHHDAGVVVEANEYYAANESIGSFNVRKLNTTITPVPTFSHIEVGDKQIITVTVNDEYAPRNATGFVNITINGETYFKKLDKDGKAVLNIYELPKGTYSNVKVDYLGDDYFNGNSSYLSFTVGQDDDYNITVLVDNIIYGQNATIYISLPTSVTQNLTIFINNTKIENVTVKNGLAKVVVPNLKAGSYIVNVTYPGDNVYAAKDKNGTAFNVNANSDWTLGLNVEAHTYGQNTIFTVTVPRDVAIKQVNLTIDGVYHPLTVNGDGIATLSLNNLTGGSHTVTANYTGDANYTTKINSANFYVEKAPSTVTITRDGNSVIATVSENATGTVTFYVNGKNETKSVVNNVARWDDVLVIGNNSVVAVYNGDMNYTVSKNSTNDFTIPRNTNSKVNVTATTVTYGNASEITVKVPAVQKGFVTITVNDTLLNVTVEIRNGEAKFNATGLDVGRYRVNVTYLGDDTYDIKENYTYFNIIKADISPVVIAQNTTVKGNASFVISVNDDFKGKVNITIGGVSYYDGDIKPVITIANIPEAGQYTASVKFYGSDNYNNKTVDSKFNVSRVDPIIDVTIDNVTYPNKAIAVVTISDYANGTINITVDGKVFNGTVVNGHVNIDITGLSAGAKVDSINFTATDKFHNNATAITKSVIDKAHSTVIITRDGNSVIATVSENATGTVTFYVNGRNHTVPVNNNVARWDNALEIGNNSVVAVYSGDKNFTSAVNSANDFTVPKNTDSKVNVTATSVVYGNASEITVKVPAVQKGYVRITINGTDINVTAEIKDGVARFNATGLDAGRYRVNVTYLGDKSYDVKDNFTTFRIYKANLNVNVIAQNATVEGNVSFVISVNDDYDGNVAVRDYNDKVKPLITINNIPEAGTYTADVEFGESKNYNATTLHIPFKVSKVDPSITVTIPDATYPNNATATITVSNRANGTVNITVGDSHFVKKITNGQVTINLTGITAGSNEATVNFTSADRYNNDLITTSKFVINKANSTVIITEDGTDVIATVTQGATGNVTFYVNGKNKTVALNGNVARWENVLSLGSNTIVAVYEGDSNYLKSSNSTSKFEEKENPVIDVNVTTPVTVWDNITINVTGPTDITGTAAVKIANKTYLVTIKEGKANITVPGLKKGTYDVNVIYLENGKYNSANMIKTVTVNKVDPTVVVKTANVTVGENVIVNVTLPDDATGTVTVSVGTYADTIAVHGGLNTIVIPPQASGKYDVSVTYNGNDKYNVNDGTAKLNVSDVGVSVDIITENITYGEKENIIIFVNGTGNVTIKLDGEELATLPIVNGKVEYEINRQMGADNYTITVDANITGNKDLVSASKKFEVAKADPVLDVNVKDIIYGQTENIIVTSTNVNGKVNITVDGITKEVSLENGKVLLRASLWTVPVYDSKATLVASGLKVGKYPVVVKYLGDENHNEMTVTAVFIVIKANSTTIDIEIESEVKAGETQIINITLGNKNATGNVSIIIDGKKYNITVKDGEANFTTPVLAPGNHSVVVIYEGDNNTASNWTSSSVSVGRYSSAIKVDVVNRTVGNKQTVTVTNIPEGATGQILIDINGQSYYVNITGTSASIDIERMPADDYKVNATYLGDSNFTSSSDTKDFTVNKNSVEIKVSVENITVGDVAIVNISGLSDLYGNVTVKVGDKSYVAYVSNGKGIAIIPNLKVDNYTVTATYNGNYKYLKDTDTAKLEVSKANITDGIKVIDQGNGTVVVVVPGNATGNVTVKVGNNTYNSTVENGTAVIYVNNETPGTHEIEVIYVGDGNNTNATIKSDITIPKYDSELKVTVSEVKEGETAKVTVEVPKNATGKVIITLDGKIYPGEIKEGKSIVEIPNVTGGDKTLIVEYSGDDNFTGNYSIKNFTVEKAKAITEPVVIDHGNGTVVIVVGDNTTGNVTVKVGDKEFNATVVNGTAVVTLENVTPGTHEVEVIYSGDDSHGNSTVVTDIVAPKYDSQVNMAVDEKDGVVTVTVKVPENATGNVTVNIGGKEYVKEIKDGEAVVKVENLTAGDHTVVVEYSGDGNFSGNYSVANFTKVADKVPADLVIVDYGNGTVVVVVGDNATGNVTVKVGDKEFNATVINGTAVVTLENITPGTHEIEVIYSGDGNHTNATSKSQITVSNVPTPIKIDVKDINVGDKAVITVTVPEGTTGDITIEIDGEKYTKEITDGVATFEIKNLIAGNKSVTASYEGDEYYARNFTSAQFKVSKVDSNISVDIKDVKVGENVTVTVKVPKDATGQVLIDINGVGYYVNVTDGMGTIEIPYLPSGTYDVNLTYTGDDKYLSSSNKSSVNVSKLESFVIPIAHNIKVGENENIRLIVPVGATGTVTVVIDEEEYVFNLKDGALGAAYSKGGKYDVAVSGGNGELVISGLPKGEYVVSVRYNGDEKYMPVVNKTMFTVSKDDSPMEVIDYGNGTVKVVVPNDAQGNVTVSDGNNTYSVKIIDGTAVINLNNTAPGKHDIEVKYSGDSDHASNATRFSVEVPKYDTPISVETSDINVGETAEITVNLPQKATGKVTIEINGKEYTADVDNGKAVFKVDNLAYGNKTVAVKYAGDDSYAENFTTGQFTVNKLSSTVNAVSKDIKVGKDEVITVTVPSDATGRVLVDIDGVGYYADVIKGKAKVIIPELPAGKYKATVTYEGDDKYLPSTTETSFKATKSTAPISVSGDDIIKLGDDATVVVNLPDDATGTVTITVDGKTYTTEVEDGHAVFFIPGLTKGNHEITAKYSGDKYYDANDTLTDIVVYYNDTPSNGTHANTEFEGNGIALSDYATANPIFVLFVMMMAIGSTQLRRLKK